MKFLKELNNLTIYKESIPIRDAFYLTYFYYIALINFLYRITAIHAEINDGKITTTIKLGSKKLPTRMKCVIELICLILLKIAW